MATQRVVYSVDQQLDSIRKLVSSSLLTLDAVETWRLPGPTKAVRRTGAMLPAAGMPQSLAELTNIVVRSYDLTTTAAGNLSVPVIGSVGGGLNRRVIVLEHTAYKEVEGSGVTYWCGYAVRFCVTVSKWDANMKVSLPFLAASAEVGNISAQWILQIIGLSGPKIDAAILPPTELNVEQFVLAKQSQEKIIEAIRDQGTVFKAATVNTIEPRDQTIRNYRGAVAEAFGLSMIENGRSFVEASKRLNADPVGDGVLTDSLHDIYSWMGLNDDTARPNNAMRSVAREILGNVKADT